MKMTLAHQQRINNYREAYNNVLNSSKEFEDDAHRKTLLEVADTYLKYKETVIKIKDFDSSDVEIMKIWLRLKARE